MTAAPLNRWRPADAVCVRDKQSDAVAYLFTSPRGRLAMLVYTGRRSKPDAHYSYASEEARARAVTAYFEARRATVARQAERRARQRKPHALELGHVFVASWGYDQTNVDFYQVVRIVGPHTVDVRKIKATTTEETAYLAGRCIPAIDDFAEAEAFRVRVTENRIKVGHQHARLWDGKPCYWSAYA